MRTVSLAFVTLVASAGLAAAVAAPAIASGPSACATVQGSVNGTDLPVNGTYCLPATA